jgi:hypothetical protein
MNSFPVGPVNMRLVTAFLDSETLNKLVCLQNQRKGNKIQEKTTKKSKMYTKTHLNQNKTKICLGMRSYLRSKASPNMLFWHTFM